MSVALVNARMLLGAGKDGDGLTEGRAVLIADGRISEVIPASDRRIRKLQHHDLKGALLLPGFIDSQVNGGGGVLFNESPSVETIAAIGRAHRRFSTIG